MPSEPRPVRKADQITDLTRLKAFTNPLRMQLYRLLYAAGSATASQLGEQVGEAPSLVSYHLRKLAELGFVAEAAGRSGDARERWWQVASEEGWGFRDSDFTQTPEGAAVVEAVGRSVFETRAAQYRAYLSQTGDWGPVWTDAAFASEWMLDLTPAELADFGEELAEVTRRWRERGQAARAAGSAGAGGDTGDREHVSVYLYGFPFRP
ncbi:winged helix-turn-helix domain-containing protein [Streptomyces rubellomurinus]|uniref:ArsR family transcriptional regulator n=1 Tax=Streptomyces rubellomurinus (strain ATCC 31215) TaxID=359131 RepID=A0A0F2TE81_STRR3|nr:helix-turn-helix domain-containing protein [Streptomyces rubellomurinus]KJS61478.1 ArsR family transcriptional regulator [Streptomyces rubellomurinus]